MEKVIQELLTNKASRSTDSLKKLALEQGANALPWLAE